MSLHMVLLLGIFIKAIIRIHALRDYLLITQQDILCLMLVFYILIVLASLLPDPAMVWMLMKQRASGYEAPPSHADSELSLEYFNSTIDAAQCYAYH